MNLRDKLKAIGDRPARPAPAELQPAADCWTRTTVRPLSEFPGAFDLDPAVLHLLQPVDLPEELDPRRILYVDTETTGLGGGAGTVAFLTGVGRLTDDGFEITQLVMRDYPEERYLLRRFEELAQEADVLCTFNGRTFDVPLLKDRFLMNRMRTQCLDLPHIDLLQTARRVWKLRLGRCSLGRLEEAILGTGRDNDLPGSEVPQRYFNYLKTKQFCLLEDVLKHNAQDIATLCVLLNHMADIYAHPEKQSHAEDLFAMGTALERDHHNEEARRCWYLCRGGEIQDKSRLMLARSWKRGGDRAEAVRIWKSMAAHRRGGAAPLIELAKHYEHHERDLSAALEMTERAMALMAEPSLRADARTVQETKNALQYRRIRLLRKMKSVGER